MIKDITLGQYFPGNSIIHRLDPRMKLIIAILFVVIIFLATTIYALTAVFVITILLAPIAKIPLKMLFKSIKPLWFIILLTTVMNVFLVNKGTILWEWKFIHISTGGLISALFIAVRIVTLILSTSIILSYTTSPIELTDAIEQLLNPLKYIKVPVHEFAMMMSIAMRFIPILIEETDKIMSAQAARGADFQNGSILRRAKALIPIFIPLFVSSIRHADELATAMECRCYHGGKGRTRMNKLRYHARDFTAFAFSIIIGVGIILVRMNFGGFSIY